MQEDKLCRILAGFPFFLFFSFSFWNNKSPAYIPLLIFMIIAVLRTIYIIALICLISYSS